MNGRRNIFTNVVMRHNVQNNGERGVVIYVSSIVLTWKVYL